jgi:enolase
VALIEAVNAREILDSRGNPTVEVEVLLDDGTVQRAAVPSGASTGAFEAYELRDADKSRYGGKGVLKAVTAVIDELGPAIEGVEASEQRIVDEILIETDGTENKKRSGANAILGVSLAVAKAAADSADLPLFRYLGGPNAHVLPIPLFNVINGGSHADNGIDCQEFFLAPIGASSFTEALRWGAETYHVLHKELKAAGYATGLGDEGGFAPDLKSNREGLDFLVKAIEKTGLAVGTDIALGMDVAATEFFNDGVYRFENKDWSAAELTDYYVELADAYPIVTIEDALAEDDWDAWGALTEKLGKKIQLVGDDLFVTQAPRLQQGITQGIGNAILIKAPAR